MVQSTMFSAAFMVVLLSLARPSVSMPSFPSHTPAPGDPDQVKLSLAGPGEMVVSWISQDAVSNVTCFDPLDFTGPTVGTFPVPFPYPLKRGCKLAKGEVSFWDGVNPSQVVQNISHLFADHDIDSDDKVAGSSSPRVVHVVRLTHLKPGTKYVYRVRSIGGKWSDFLTMKTLPAAGNPVSLLITADVGTGGIPSPAIQEATSGGYDMHLHGGDMAYDMPINFGAQGDQFFNELSAISSRIPFQAWPGNHETDDNFCDFLNYRARFFNQNLTGDASGSGNSRYYSFDVPGMLHVAGIDTDAYAEPDFNTPGNGYSGQSFFVKEQFEWLERDLAKVDRKKTPWVFLVGHHPMYCSSKGEAVPEAEADAYDAANGNVEMFPKLSCRAAGAKKVARWAAKKAKFHQQLDRTVNRTGVSAPAPAPYSPAWCYDCGQGAAMIRNGCTDGHLDSLPSEIPSCGVGTGRWNGMKWGLEDLLEKYNVDMYFTGHIHMYERSWPVLRDQVQLTYDKPTFPVHINTGNSGSKNDFINGPDREFTAFRLTGVGCYSSVKIHNATHLSFAQKSADNGTVIDSFELVKERNLY